jgi:hypothetical protein
MTIFETEEDLKREKKAIETFVNTFGGSYKKLDPLDVDYKIFDKNDNLIAYAEVKGRIRNIRNAYPLPISITKVAKLIDKRLVPVIIWACDDGIIYGIATKLEGHIKFGGRKPREGSYSDEEMMAYFEKQKTLKYVRFDLQS